MNKRLIYFIFQFKFSFTSNEMDKQLKQKKNHDKKF